MLPRWQNVVMAVLGAISIGFGVWIPTWGPPAAGWLIHVGVIMIGVAVVFWIVEWVRLRRLRRRGVFDEPNTSPATETGRHPEG